jgi:hypothetical protein
MAWALILPRMAPIAETLHRLKIAKSWPQEPSPQPKAVVHDGKKDGRIA